MKMFSLKDEIAFVTGAGSGIGQGIAIGLAEAGADVALFDLPGSRASTTPRRRSRDRAAGRSRLTGDVVGRPTRSPAQSKTARSDAWRA